jgi:cyclophilin family peptidyl-prolyl cis-trans isomerase
MKRMFAMAASLVLCLAGARLWAGDTATASTRAIIKLAKGGEIVIKFYPQDAPKSVANFIDLAKKGFYDGLTFHRVIPGFVAQGGDPAGNGSGGPGYTIKGEFTDNGVNNKQKHVKGAVAMARTSIPDSAGSQFYICLADLPDLDGKYSVFGQVVKGMDYVEQIQIGDKMSKVTITQGAPVKAAAASAAAPTPVDASATPAATGTKN